MVDALRFIFRGVKQALFIILNLDIMLSDNVTLKFYWLIVLVGIMYYFLDAAYQYLKGDPKGGK